KNAFLEVNHSIKQKDYVDWKYSVLQSIVKNGPKLRNGNGNRIACRFYTCCSPEITDLFRYFYKDRKKIIPDDLQINPFSLAVWYMDDGSKSGDSIYLNTQQFSIEDQNKLQKLLLNQFNINSNLNKDKEYMRIRIITADAKKFCNIIREFIPQSMQYKLV
ncbi:MAG: hypothetical protein UX24_C0009G0014, partial [Candidatus Giovannonibacteria bacterium GW2011_GWB1_45_9b]